MAGSVHDDDARNAAANLIVQLTEAHTHAGTGQNTGKRSHEGGAQLIVLLDELDMVIVTTADPFLVQHGGQSWAHQKAIINLVGNSIKSLPKE